MTLPEVHGVDKGIDPNIKLEKQVIKQIISYETKCVSQIKPRLGEGRAGIKQKKKTIKLPVSPPSDNPIIQIAENQFLQKPQNIIQPKKIIENFSSRKFLTS